MTSKVLLLIIALPISACLPEPAERDVVEIDQVRRGDLFAQCLELAKPVGAESYTAGKSDQGIGDLVDSCDRAARNQSYYCVSGCRGDTGKPWDRINEDMDE